MNRVKQLAKRIPGLVSLYRSLLKALEARRLRRLSAEEVFTDIFRRNYWGGMTSISGTGSDSYQVGTLIQELPSLLRELRITTLLDIPCGDFHWMKEIDWQGIDYIGADIVLELIELNRKSHGGGGRRFVHLDVMRDPLPRADLILCRDCLVHFSFVDASRALRNLCAGRSGYLLTTTFPGRARNDDIATGQWRPLNLQAPPFSLPSPLRVISEHCTEEQGAYADKSLGLWAIEQIVGAPR